ncbi:DoxX family protein [Candidatus Nomurabacteria bacterium]|nr:DoxX family protein [Candidatus Nomurabacteria bacterium]
MLSESHKAMMRTHGTMVGRMLIGLLFVYSAVGMIMSGTGNTAAYFMSAGVPLASLMVWVVLAVKIVGGGALMLGIRTEQAAMALIVFTLAATWFGHVNPTDSISILKNLAIVGGLLYTLAYGPGEGWKL